MKKSDFWFNLPEEQIAQTPVYPRDSSRLLKLDRKTGKTEDLVFTDIEKILNKGDLLVLNDSRVIPARLYGNKEESGGKIEFLMLNMREKDVWEIMVKPGKKAKPGSKFIFGDGILKAEIIDSVDGGNRLAKFTYDGDNIYDILDKIGNMPLPPYITKKLEDNERYQTVYSKEVGSAAAPTAGLHFTPELMKRLEEKGVRLAYVTLHVGLGTFRPVKEDEITDHKMHTEQYFLPEETAKMIKETKAAGGRVIAVGTTACRTLESVATFKGEIMAAHGDTDIFIYPGYEFKVLDGIITNFHLPESTLIMLVSAFAGYEHTMNAYDHAVKDKYRFFSFGDAMIIL